jgi:major membrane immunogen (membrane-anchored lipoprotein)
MKMKYLLPIMILLLVLMSFSSKNRFKDGVYTGTSRSIYTEEEFYGKVKILVEKNKIVSIDFVVRDSNKHEDFDAKYEKYYKGNDLYVQQCRNDWKGIQTYPEKLLKSQDPDKIDAITGATWSYNIFKAAVKEALPEDKKGK